MRDLEEVLPGVLRTDLEMQDSVGLAAYLRRVRSQRLSLRGKHEPNQWLRARVERIERGQLAASLSVLIEKSCA